MAAERAGASDLAPIDAFVRQHGLVLRGGFHPETADGVPPLPDGRAVATLLLVGSIGGSLWPAFSQAPELADGAADPLDRWTRRVLAAIAAAVGASPLFPFGGPPYLPFQRWAMRAEPVAPSPLGVLIHPDYGLWHAYRGALAFAAPLALPAAARRARPCDRCDGRPCLSACPVGAFTDSGYDVAHCIGHLDGEAGGECRTGGCLARRACPVGRVHGYGAPQAAFHMAAFHRANRARS